MKCTLTLVATLLLTLSAFPQERPKPVTIPITLDHNRIVIDVYLPLPDGTTKRVRAWVDSGHSDLTMSQRIASLFGTVHCEGQVCTATPPREMLIGGMKISLSEVHEAHVPAGLPNDVMIPGMSPEINFPSTVLRAYDIVLDYANREFTIGEPGTVLFKGKSTKAQVNSLGMVQIPCQIEGQTQQLALETGASISLVSNELLSKWHASHPSWPFMTGSVGPANMFGGPDEVDRSVLQLASLQCGGNILTHVSIGSLAATSQKRFQERAGNETVGLLGGDAFRNYRLGIDYVHSTVYLDRVSNTPASDMSVVGLTLRAEPNGRFTIIAIADYAGKPSVPDVKAGDILLGVDGAPATGATIGQVWSLLGGTPRQTRSLTLEREGKRFTVDAPIHRFLAPQTGKSQAMKITRKAPGKK